MVLTATAGARIAPSAVLAAHQEPRGIGQLVVPGDRVEITYTVDTKGVQAPTGALYVRSDDRRFESVVLKPSGRAALSAVVPARLIRGHRLLYYAVLRDPKTGCSVRVPAGGAARPQSAWVLERSVTVKLGAHRFGHTPAPEAVVARAAPADVGRQLGGAPFGPQPV